MNDLKLVKPHRDLKDEYLSFYQEWKESGEDVVPWVISVDPSDFEAMLNFLENHEKGVGLPEGWVSDYLINAGGHIGYGIRPSERGKGYATTLLRLSLVEAKILGIEDVLVVCDAWNVASEKTIVKNGGRSDIDYIEEDGNIIRRYWIKNV
ncbi:GNAT family N-acetyltransferase [Fontibacillus sp. BL9]|uniref:GNAT family N-acetyltransferase n=1 Tax=Fontibacillus sp. BL9 TaxID=3389971 RepID=UPI00397D2E2B